MAKAPPARSGQILLDELRRAYTGPGGEGPPPAAPAEPARAKAERLLALLDARAVPVSAPQRRQILGCRDRARLEDWLRRAATVSGADELLGE